MSFRDRLKQLKDTVVEKVKEKKDQLNATISNMDLTTIPVPLIVIETLLAKQLPKISGLTLTIEDGCLVIKGNIFIIIPFRILLRPRQTFDRQIEFEVVRFSPFNFELVKRLIFRGSKICKYTDNRLTIDFDSIDLLRRIPVLKLVDVELDGKKVCFKLGMK